MRSMVISSGLMLALTAVPSAAQVTVDVAKINCEQLTLSKITDPKNIAIWLSGYYHGKRGSTLLDPQALEADSKKVNDYCIRNPKVLVMQAVETLLGAPK